MTLIPTVASVAQGLRLDIYFFSMFLWTYNVSFKKLTNSVFTSLKQLKIIARDFL